MAKWFRPVIILSSLALLVQTVHPIAPVGDAFAQAPAAKPRKLRFLAASHAHSVGFDQELESAVAEYNRLHPETRVELERKGRGFSTLKELMVAHFAGSAPAIAMIEPSEIPSAVRAGAARPIDTDAAGARAAKLLPIFDPEFVEQSRSESGDLVSLPFLRSAPVLIADQEMLFRHHLDPHRLPAGWTELRAHMKILARGLESGAGRYVLALPLTGDQGVWLFEALAGKPLWESSRPNPALEPTVTELQKLIDSPTRARPGATMESAMADFLARKASFLAGSLDVLPHIHSGAAFRWRAGPLPTPNGAQAVLSGAQLVLGSPSDPAVWSFLEYLYSPRVAPKWTMAGGYLPVSRAWMKSAEWKSAELKVFGPHSTHSALLGAIFDRGIGGLRASSPDVVRLRSLWERTLSRIFGPRSGRIPFQSALKDFD